MHCRNQSCGSWLTESGYGSHISSESGSGSYQDPGFLMTNNWIKCNQVLIFYWSHNKKLSIRYLSVGLPIGRTSYRRGLQPSKGLTSSNYWLTSFYFFGSFWPSWIPIANTDTDPGTQLNPDQWQLPKHKIKFHRLSPTPSNKRQPTERTLQTLRIQYNDRNIKVDDLQLSGIWTKQKWTMSWPTSIRFLHFLGKPW